MRHLLSTPVMMAFLLLYMACSSVTGTARGEAARRLLAACADIARPAGGILSSIPANGGVLATQP